jgi:hypothetical protein
MVIMFHLLSSPGKETEFAVDIRLRDHRAIPELVVKKGIPLPLLGNELRPSGL